MLHLLLITDTGLLWCTTIESMLIFTGLIQPPAAAGEDGDSWRLLQWNNVIRSQSDWQDERQMSGNEEGGDHKSWTDKKPWIRDSLLIMGENTANECCCRAEAAYCPPCIDSVYQHQQKQVCQAMETKERNNESRRYDCRVSAETRFSIAGPL